MNGSIRRRSKDSWELTIDLGRDTDGKRKRKFVSVKGSKAGAQKKLRELLSSLDKDIPIGTQKITFGLWLSKWMAEYVVPNKRQKTIERYEGLIQKHIAPDLSRIESTPVRRWTNHCLWGSGGWTPPGRARRRRRPASTSF